MFKFSYDDDDLKSHSEQCNLEMGNCKASLIKIRRGAFLFTGMKNKPNTINANIYEEQSGQEDSGSVTSGIVSGVRATFASPVLSKVNMEYGIGGIVLISLVTRDFIISAWSDPNCIPFFDTKEDYAGEEFRCFCDKGTRGYATTVDGCGIGRCFDDIAICDIEEVAIPYGYISYTDYQIIQDNGYDPYTIAQHINYIDGYRSSQQSYIYCLIVDGDTSSCDLLLTNNFLDNYTDQVVEIEQFKKYEI